MHKLSLILMIFFSFCNGMEPQAPAKRAYNTEATEKLKTFEIKENPFLAKLLSIFPKFPESILDLFSYTVHTKIKLLIKQGADPNIPTNIKDSNNNICLPIQIAIGGEDIDLLNFLLQSGADPNTCYSNSVSVLMHAAFQNYPKAVEALLANGADPRYQNTANQTVRNYADHSNNPDIKQLLLCEKQKIA